MNELCVRNRQSLRAVNTRLLRQITLDLLQRWLPTPNFNLGIYIVSSSEMESLNETFLRHHGSTDVITFQYSEPDSTKSLHGEIFICVDDALKQARQFHARWQAEIVRYLVHGILHLKGFDDTTPAARKIMKLEEERVLKELAEHFSFGKVGSKG